MLHFHSAVQSDLRQALAYFDRVGGAKLGDRFFTEVEALIAQITAHPTRYGFLEADIRRAPLHAFRYQLLYRIRPDGIRVLVLRHNRRHPRFGLSRR